MRIGNLQATYGPTLDQLGVPWTDAGGMTPADWGWYDSPAVTPKPGTAPRPPAAATGVTVWLNQNQTAVIMAAAALFLLAMFGGKR